MENFTTLLTIAISALAPVSGVSVGRINDKSTWRVDFNNATPAQRQSVEAFIQSFDVTAGFNLLKLQNERKEATNKFDKEDRRFAMVLIDEINRLRKRQLDIHNLLQANPTYAGYRTAVLNLPTANLQPVTGDDLKTAMRNKD